MSQAEYIHQWYVDIRILDRVLELCAIGTSNNLEYKISTSSIESDPRMCDRNLKQYTIGTASIRLEP